jgi:hypothetical protein
LCHVVVFVVKEFVSTRHPQVVGSV